MAEFSEKSAELLSPISESLTFDSPIWQMFQVWKK